VTADGTAVVRVAVPERVQHAGILRATLTISGLGLALLVVAVFAADRMAVRLSAPIRSVVVTAEALREGDLETRAAEEGPAEVVALARALNRLASRIAQLLASERDAVADLSHRLRTPVTALRLDADLVADPEVAERLHEHVEQLERTVSAIVRDARRPVRASLAALCDVSRVVADRVAFWSALAEEQGRRLRLELPRQPAYAKIDAADLTDAVDVMIDNVFAHTQDGVAVEIWVTADRREGVIITVEDAGPGLPGGDVVGRGRSGAGSTGLGLDIVRRAALASGGRLELGRSRMGGALVRMVLGPPER
jgi:signal transduction histidine kinase